MGKHSAFRIAIGLSLNAALVLAGDPVSVFGDGFEDGAVCRWSSWVSPSLPGGCLIEDECYGVLEANPLEPCEVCDPTISEDSWSTSADETPCDDGLFCTSASHCLGGICTADEGAPNPCGVDTACATYHCSEEADACGQSVHVGAVCGEDTCADGSAGKNVYRCAIDSEADCDPLAVFCQGYVCRDNACLDSCASDEDCASDYGYVCLAGACVIAPES